MGRQPQILVYRNEPIKISETFIYNQSIMLSRYKAFLLGAKAPGTHQMELPGGRVKLINQGNLRGFLREACFKVLGIIPRDILNWVKELDPQLIHAHFGDDGTTVMPLALKLKIPLIVSFLGTDATMKDEYARRAYLRKRLYLLRRKKLAKTVTRVIVPSEFLKNRVMEHGFSEEKISVIFHGVDLSQFKPLAEPPNFGNILFVGRLIPRKGLDYLIAAIALAREEFPNTTLTVIGDGPNREEYEQSAREILKDGYEFLGFQPHQVVSELMAKAYLFSLPSITMPSGESETFGLVFIEAQAMGVPVVSFSSGGIPEVVIDGKTGFLCEEGQVDDLAEKIKVLLRNPDLRNEMGQAGYRWVKDTFDLKAQTEKLEQFYDEILNPETD